MERTIGASAGSQPWSKRLGTGARAFGLVACLLLLGAGGSQLERVIRTDNSQGAALDGASWEGRRLIAQMLWLKTHSVLHAGVEEREARPGEEVTRANEYHTHGGGHDKGHGTAPADSHEVADPDGDHDGHVFVIPPKREDFRGILGDLEREVKPYSDSLGHVYSKGNEQTIPFYRVITWSDPHYIQAYTVGAAFIGDAGNHADQGIAFLLEGERSNPDSFEIQTELGHFYLVYKKNYAEAEKHLLRSLALVHGKTHLTDMEDDARTDAYRWLALDYSQWNRPHDAVRVATEGIHVLGKDPPLQHILSRAGQK